MAKVSISEAIKLSGVSRSSFYGKYIKQGQISISVGHDGKKQVDTSELIRVFGELKSQPSTVHVDTSKESKKNTLGQDEKTEIMLIRQQLQEAQSRELAGLAQVEELRKDKVWLQSQITNLTDSIKLLEAPKNTTPIYPRLWWQFWK